MDIFNAIVDSSLLFFLAAFSWAPQVVGLSVLAAAAGVAMLWVWGKTSDQARMKKVKNGVWAALFELRVYVDEPRVTWRAQKALFTANFRYMALALRPALWMIAPMALLLVHQQQRHGRNHPQSRAQGQGHIAEIRGEKRFLRTPGDAGLIHI